MSKKSFEAAYERLEEILEKMNTEQVSLDSALSLYEEADSLIGDCQKRLTEAEQKIEILIKNRILAKVIRRKLKKSTSMKGSVDFLADRLNIPKKIIYKKALTIFKDNN